MIIFESMEALNEWKKLNNKTGEAVTPSQVAILAKAFYYNRFSMDFSPVTIEGVKQACQEANLISDFWKVTDH